MTEQPSLFGEDEDPVQVEDVLEEASPSAELQEESPELQDVEPGSEIEIKVQLSPETMKKLKILAILSSPGVVASLKQQLERQINVAFDRLITEELQEQLQASGVIGGVRPASLGAGHSETDDINGHSLSGDDAEEEAPSLEEQAEKLVATPKKKDQGQAGNQFPIPKAPDVGEDADAFLDAMLAPTPDADDAFMGANSPARARRASKSYDPKRKAAVSAALGEDLY